MGAISGSSLTIGVAILVLTITGSLEWFAKITPRVAVRGIQLGLALTLVMTSIRFMQKTGTMSVLGIDIPYYALTILSFVMVAALANNRKIPALFILIPMGMGLAADYRFGARTVAAPIVIGLFLVSLGLLYGKALTAILNLFPLPILGVILFFSVLELALVARDVTRKYELLVAILVAAICAFVPYGFLVGWPTGIILGRALERKAQPLAKLVNTAGTSPQIDC